MTPAARAAPASRRRAPARAAPALRALALAAALSLASCLSFPLGETPYRIIRADHPGKKTFLLRVEMKEEEDRFDYVISPNTPTDEQVRAVVCESLSQTPFRCPGENDQGSRPDYVLRVFYGVVSDHTPFLGGVRRFFFLKRGKLHTGRDDDGETRHELQWRFSVRRPAGKIPLFKSESLREEILFWEGNLGYWIGRHFSE